MAEPNANPYETLGVPRTASAAQVRAAYRRLAKQYHPDLHAETATTERMQRINQAWETLSNPAERARYDAKAAVRPAASYPHWASGRRATEPPYPSQQSYWRPRPSWATSAPYGGGEAWREDDDGGPWRWGLALVAVPVAVLLFALFGAIVPLPILGILVFVIARAAFGGRD